MRMRDSSLPTAIGLTPVLGHASPRPPVSQYSGALAIARRLAGVVRDRRVGLAVGGQLGVVRVPSGRERLAEAGEQLHRNADAADQHLAEERLRLERRESLLQTRKCDGGV